MKAKRLFVDVHVIQTLPPSNVNRDDTGSPKHAQYGGVTRARVSSQSWKKAMRDYFRENGDLEVGVRTVNVVSYVKDAIIRKEPSITEEEALIMARNVITGAGVSLTKDDKAKALFFLGKKQADQLAEAAINGIKDKKELQKLMNDNPAIDIALFGRMVADDATMNQDASAQVAHAISTHGVQSEFDYYTALDDNKAEESNAGAGMLGTIEFNSSTLYRYADVAAHEFLLQMNDDKEVTVKALKLFVEAFVNSLPTGKVNTFANETLPQVIMVNVRDDRPVSLVTAFEKPVQSDNGYIEPSVERLVAELDHSQKFVHKPLLTLYLASNDQYAQPKDGMIETSLPELLDDFGKAIMQYL